MKFFLSIIGATIVRPFLIALLCGIVFLSCSKTEETASFEEEVPLPDFLTTAGFNADVNTASNTSYLEAGLTFKPLEFGTIKAITVKLPVNPSRIRVTLWDKATGNALVTARIPLVLDYVAGTTYEVAITPYALTKNKEYIISMNTENWVTRQRAGATDADYPITIGTIQFINHVSSVGQNQVIPSTISLSYIAGDIGFKFQRI